MKYELKVVRAKSESTLKNVPIGQWFLFDDDENQIPHKVEKIALSGFGEYHAIISLTDQHYMKSSQYLALSHYPVTLIDEMILTSIVRNP